MQAKKENKKMKRFTVEGLAVFCKGLYGITRDEAIKYGKANGVSKHYVDVLRGLLGMVKPRNKAIGDAMRNLMAEDVANGTSVTKVARKYGVFPTTVYKFCKERGVDYNHHDFWTQRKIMELCIYIKEDKPELDREHARKLGVNITTYRSMKQRLKNQYHCKKWVPLARKMGLYDK